jgi:hypothetical protein
MSLKELVELSDQGLNEAYAQVNEIETVLRTVISPYSQESDRTESHGFVSLEVTLRCFYEVQKAGAFGKAIARCVLLFVVEVLTHDEYII